MGRAPERPVAIATYPIDTACDPVPSWRRTSLDRAREVTRVRLGVPLGMEMHTDHTSVGHPARVPDRPPHHGAQYHHVSARTDGWYARAMPRAQRPPGQRASSLNARYVRSTPGRVTLGARPLRPSRAGGSGGLLSSATLPTSRFSHDREPAAGRQVWGERTGQRRDTHGSRNLRTSMSPPTA